ncbi:MAG: BON domain-containing protein [Chloroflexi bacterium]|nr:MAG: BON domain-containing protein [Chloroflexota bacterium]
MKTMTNISQMRKFYFGGKIFCTDGEVGSLAHVVFHSSTRRMTHLGMKPHHLFGKTIDLPYDAVAEATGEGIRLSITYEELMAISKVGVEGTVLDHRTLLERIGSKDKGMLLLIALHPENGVLAYLVVRHLHPGHDILLQEQYVKTIASRQVIVALSDATLSVLPPYRPDQELQQEVERVLFELTPLHLDIRGFTVHVLDSVVYLDGNISSQLRADIVENQILSVPGLLEIKNHLLGDDRLAADLAMALAQDPRIRDLPLGIYPRLGVVRLGGAVHTKQQLAAVEEVVAKYPGVRSVINDLTVDPNADLLPVLLPTGMENEDKVPGKYVRHTK